MKVSPQKAINQHCKGCVYDSAEKGNWREQVEACTITHCELYSNRPVTSKTKRLQRENYLASLTPAEREIEAEKTRKASERMLSLQIKAKTELGDLI